MVFGVNYLCDEDFKGFETGVAVTAVLIQKAEGEAGRHHQERGRSPRS